MYTRVRLAAMAARPLARVSTPLRSSLVSRSPALCRINHTALRKVIAGRAYASTIVAPPSDSVAPPAEDATENTIAEEKDTGHFDVKDNEAILFFDSMQSRGLRKTQS